MSIHVGLYETIRYDLINLLEISTFVGAKYYFYVIKYPFWGLLF